MRGLRHFKVRGKLAPRFVGPFKFLEKRGEEAYQLELLPQLSDVHDVFHVSQLKCLRVPEEQCLWKIWMLERIFLVKSILSRFWKHLRELLKTRRLGCARCNGAITPRKKLLGKEKN
jgi:hypothetical protein